VHRFFILGLLIGAGWTASAQTEAVQPASPLEPEVRRIFERSCAECHDVAQRSRPKGGFGYVLDMERLKGSDYVVAGEPGKSDLYLALIDPDPEIVMPPPDSDAPPLSAEEIKAVHAWITSLGAPVAAVAGTVTEVKPPETTEPVVPVNPAETTGAVKAMTEEAKPGPSLVRVFARMHQMVVHFPIALLIVAAMADWLGVAVRRQKEWLPVVRWTLTISSVAAVVAISAGWLLAEQEGYKPATVFLHRWLGVATAVAACAGWGLLEWAERKGSVRLRWASRLVILAGAVLVSLAGHTGGELVYGAGYPFN
jgi:uncharacterized membrane protein/mono/diheme cytochrome c family protein